MSPRRDTEPAAAAAAQPAEVPAQVSVQGEVTGEPIEFVAQPAATDETRQRAKDRTKAQAFQGATAVTILVWLLRLVGVDLNPLPGQDDIPAEVGAALGGFLTWLGAVWMNRQPRDEGGHGDVWTIAGVLVVVILAVVLLRILGVRV